MAREGPPATAPELMEASWERRDAPRDVRLTEAERMAEARVRQIITFVRRLAEQSRPMQAVLAAMAGEEFDAELLDANIAKIVAGNGAELESFVSIERTLGQHVNAHDDLSRLREMIELLRSAH